MTKKKFDFGGYATKNDIKCSDGRVIRKDAFLDNDGITVPLVWQHIHDDPNNVLGHALLENRPDGVYAYCSFNDTEAGRSTKILVSHGDIKALSIYAKELKQQGASVLHGAIKEVSLVLAGANPGALIDNLSIQHSDGEYETLVDEAIIYADVPISTDDIEHADAPTPKTKPEDETVQDVFDTLSEKQKNVVYAMLTDALEEGGTAKHSDIEEDTEAKTDEKVEMDTKKDAEIDTTKKPDGDKTVTHSFGGGKIMKNNVFDKSTKPNDNKVTLSHSEITDIFTDARKMGSLKDSFLSHVQTYGVENIDYLFPDARMVNGAPEVIKRDDAWVTGVLSGANHTPFSRIKSTAVDITADEARARGYFKGTLKKEEVIRLLKRITTPQTIYKKQKLDRDDIIDITDLDVVVWLKAEMRVMLDEEIARAVLVGDGRSELDESKIKTDNVRPIYSDEEIYAPHVDVDKEAKVMVDDILRARKLYKGSGSPILYCNVDDLIEMLLIRDTTGRKVYTNSVELSYALGVSSIVEVPIMEGVNRMGDEATPLQHDLVGIIVNLKDYTIGADKGGAINMFDDFDIDYNQYKYLIETRCSGALTKPYSAIVIEKLHA